MNNSESGVPMDEEEYRSTTLPYHVATVYEKPRQRTEIEMYCGVLRIGILTVLLFAVMTYIFFLFANWLAL